MEDDRMIPLSYISQYHYCKRRTGLLMLEQQWADSTDTVKGTAEHKNVHTASIEKRNGIYVISELQVFSKIMQLHGKCDSVEAYETMHGAVLPFLDEGRYSLYPIEYKHGKLRTEEEYELQLCAQAMCMEEMYACRIKKGAVFFINSHRRKEVIFSDAMREQVGQITERLSDMLIQRTVPQAEPCAKCIRCSLREICMPETEKTVAAYLCSIAKEFRKEV